MFVKFSVHTAVLNWSWLMVAVLLSLESVLQWPGHVRYTVVEILTCARKAVLQQQYKALI